MSLLLENMGQLVCEEQPALTCPHCVLSTRKNDISPNRVGRGIYSPRPTRLGEISFLRVDNRNGSRALSLAHES